MVPIKKRTDEQIETDCLLPYLESVASEINEPFSSFHASVDKSGLIPQLHIRENQ